MCHPVLGRNHTPWYQDLIERTHDIVVPCLLGTKCLNTSVELVDLEEHLNGSEGVSPFGFGRSTTVWV